MADLYDQSAPDTEDFVACWMQPVMRAAVERDLDDNELPFCEITRVDGADDPDSGTDDAVIQLDFYGLGPEAAKTAADEGHRRMIKLIRESPSVTLSDGTVADLDYGDVLIKPARMAYAHDRIVRYTGRYKLGTSYVAVD
ncbi:putative head-to-tail connector protein [Mycobacterium phage HC]|uniref:Tail terminator n=3 Tax=Brujitavirus TaxID=2169611 RepID=G8I6P5_9CAUD|nr:hypothetical protein [Mycolicibacterium smegmatis]YP_009013029.1 head-tail adaptor [Mycobacterium phage Babsiella]YP_010088192.1 head-tail adaptor [Mycobacterium phage HC]YP_010104151.1 head-tail adaptor [Mycobacterium phage Xula]QFG15020.1 tail terminator [Mycobacterium phage QueenHazel]WRQ08154.1 hypothetical protein JDBV06_00635 [Mycobacterium phage dwieneke]WRQ08735.1 hypothetical protein JDBV09_00050 [Mycobacterium phage mika]WRQ08948.1 hypothetical protein JDBV03_01680 [Mycobacteriu